MSFILGWVPELQILNTSTVLPVSTVPLQLIYALLPAAVFHALAQFKGFLDTLTTLAHQLAVFTAVYTLFLEFNSKGEYIGGAVE